MHFCHYFDCWTFPIPWKCLTIPTLPTNLIPLSKLYYAVSEIVNLVETEDQKNGCQFSIVTGWLFADGQRMGLSAEAEVFPGMPCMWLNLWTPPNLHLCGFMRAYRSCVSKCIYSVSSSDGGHGGGCTVTRSEWLVWKGSRLRGGADKFEMFDFQHPCVAYASTIPHIYPRVKSLRLLSVDCYAHQLFEA